MNSVSAAPVASVAVACRMHDWQARPAIRVGRVLLRDELDSRHTGPRRDFVHVCTLHFFDRQWVIDLAAGVAASDKSAKLRESAAAEIRALRERWDSDDRRRELEPDVVARTERHAGRWIVIRDGRVVTISGKAGRVFRRELARAGASTGWHRPEWYARGSHELDAHCRG